MEYRILPRSEVEDMVRNFIIDNNIYAKYGTDSEGLFQVNFVVEEEKEEIDRLNREEDCQRTFGTLECEE